MKVCFIDTETTGANLEINSIFELAAILDIDGKYTSRFCENAKPFDGDKIHPEALKVTGKTEEEIWGFPKSQRRLKRDFQNWMTDYVDPMDKEDKMHFVGYNASFDYSFARRLWEEMDDPYFGSFFFFPYIDIMTICGWALMSERTQVKDFKLFTVAHAMGITVNEEKCHGAMYDCRLARSIYYALEK